MGNDEELKGKVIEWFNKTSREGRTRFSMRDVVNALVGEYEKRAIQKAVNDCTVDGTLMYWSSGSTTMLTLPENFPKSVT
jgi:hypothetical protein